MILTRQRPASRPVALVGLALAGLLLTGCGTSLGIYPGSAVVVGGETLSMSKIDSTATLYCKAYLPQIQQSSGGRIPMRYLRQFVAASLAERLLGQQLARAYHVSPTSQYQQQVGQVEQQFASSPDDERQAVLDVEGGDPYLQTVQVAIGQKLTGNYGQASADVKASLQRGQVATQDWLKDHDVRIDPVFGVSIDGGQFKPKLDETSYPLSPLASSGAKQSSTPDASYTAALTPAQLCG